MPSALLTDQTTHYTDDLYTLITIPHIFHHLETLRQKHISKRYENFYPLQLDTLYLDATLKPQHPPLITCPISLPINIYLSILADNHLEIPHLTPFPPQDHPIS